jgi:hypothetical protein
MLILLSGDYPPGQAPRIGLGTTIDRRRRDFHFVHLTSNDFVVLSINYLM